MKITNQNCIELICDENNPYLGDFHFKPGIKFFKFRRRYYKYIGWELMLRDSPKVKRYK